MIDEKRGQKGSVRPMLVRLVLEGNIKELGLGYYRRFHGGLENAKSGD